MPAESGISSAPADVSERVIEAVRLIVFSLELLPSAVRIALRKSLSVPTLNVLDAIRGWSLRRAGSRIADGKPVGAMIVCAGTWFVLLAKITANSRYSFRRRAELAAGCETLPYQVLRIRSATSDPDPSKGDQAYVTFRVYKKLHIRWPGRARCGYRRQSGCHRGYSRRWLRRKGSGRKGSEPRKGSEKGVRNRKPISVPDPFVRSNDITRCGARHFIIQLAEAMTRCQRAGTVSHADW